MEQHFAVTDPRDDARSGNLIFTVRDGATTIPGRISSAAMQILRDDSGFTPAEVFTANKARIRTAAYKVRLFHPQMATVVLGVSDFS